MRFVCRYAAPDNRAGASSQDRRRRKREALEGRRRAKNGTFGRAGNAEAAYPRKRAMGLKARGVLHETQIAAIATYLYLKIVASAF